jgi:hypothetical protein
MGQVRDLRANRLRTKLRTTLWTKLRNRLWTKLWTRLWTKLLTDRGRWALWRHLPLARANLWHRSLRQDLSCHAVVAL